MRRTSRLSIPSSGAKSFTSAAMRASIPLASNRVMGPTPDLPASIACQFLSTPVPSAVMSPVPVMTTRRFDMGKDLAPAPGPALLLVGVDVVDGVPDGLDVLGLLVRDLHLELLFHRHHQLDDVQAVRTEVLDEGGLGLDLVLTHAQLVGDDRLDLGLDCTRRHLIPPVPSFSKCCRISRCRGSRARGTSERPRRGPAGPPGRARYSPRPSTC